MHNELTNSKHMFYNMTKIKRMVNGVMHDENENNEKRDELRRRINALTDDQINQFILKAFQWLIEETN